jgi:hypothetical protein
MESISRPDQCQMANTQKPELRCREDISTVDGITWGHSNKNMFLTYFIRYWSRYYYHAFENYVQFVRKYLTVH